VDADSGDMAPRVVPRRPASERGAILIVVLVLTVTFAMLSLALLSTAEMSLRVQSNGRDIERAERAAQSGVEWAAAVVKANGFVDGVRATTLTPGVVVSSSIRSSTAPHLLGGGAAYGVVAYYGADADFVDGAHPHALLAFGGMLQSNDDVTIRGSAYAGGTPTALTFNAVRPLGMDGDLQLVTTVAPTNVRHISGTTQLGVAALTEPAWNTTRFTLLQGWTVPTHVFNGSTTLTNRTLTGIVIVNLLAGQALTLEDVTIDGTLVVPSLYPPVLEVLGVPQIKLQGTVTINGGTADTGNLAILAPTTRLIGDRGVVLSVKGVAYLRTVEDCGELALTGMLMVRRGVASATNGTVTIDRPDDFVPKVPYGITWTGANTVRMTWRGKQ